MSPQEVLEFAKKNDAKQLDLRFTDIPSLQHHVSYPINELDEDSFEEGFGMDGSSIRGWAAIHESDMLLIPDPNTAFMDPFAEIPTLVMYGDVKDPITGKPYGRDPRYIVQKAEAYLKSADLAHKKIHMILPEGMLELNAPLTAEEKEQQRNSKKKMSS